MARYTPRCLLLLVAAAGLVLLLPAANALCDAGDKNILLALKASLGNPVSLFRWTADTDCCDDWPSTWCNGAGRVTTVDIQSAADANGTIPASIGGLTFLERLVIRQCPVTGTIPDAVCKLTRLQHLQFERTNLTGGIPGCLDALSNYLVYLNLAQNKLTGIIPSSIGRLYNLVVLYLDGNQLGCAIPTNADNLKGLSKFDVSKNQLCGAIPQGGVINKFPAFAFQGNKCLCGNPLAPCLINQCNCPYCADGETLSSSSFPVEVSR